MKLSHRIFLGYFLIVAIAGVLFLRSVRDELRPAVRQTMEESIVDAANLLAEIVEKDMVDGTLATSNFSQALTDFSSRDIRANIWGLSKNMPTYRLYITDDKGIVIYDSDGGHAVGEDYSNWNDVYLTLRGKYGARSTKANPNDPDSTVMYVAAPIMHQGKIIGVLTLSKPNISVLPFILLSQQNIMQAVITLLVISLFLGWILSNFLARSTQKLAEYANTVRQGRKAELPHISESELSQLGHAIEEMRIALEGKEYVEQYVHTLTHEIKSPLSGITGAAELLSENMDAEARHRFISNIQEDTRRIQHIVDRMLDLARVEKQQTLEHREEIDLEEITKDIVDSLETRLLQKSLRCKFDIEVSNEVYGDPFLIRQALNNVLENAIDFSPKHGEIFITGKGMDSGYTLTVHDEGRGIPDYAEDKIFERFYSLPRPDTGKKSSGLGLSFVKEVMLLHQGDIRITSDDTGCVVSLIFSL